MFKNYPDILSSKPSTDCHGSAYNYWFAAVAELERTQYSVRIEGGSHNAYISWSQ